MASTPRDDSGSATPGAHSLHQNHLYSRRLHRFVHPDGRDIHVASSPTEQTNLLRQLSSVQMETTFEVLLRGSTEHVEAVRELHSHHEETRNLLREQHGDLYEQIEKVKNELDALSMELNSVTNTEHGVSLDANFSKYGYSAHLRTKDDDEVSSLAESDSPNPHKSYNSRDAQPLVFFRRPVIRQYFHKGLLWRSSRSGEVGSFELFADLLYVGIVGIIGDRAVETPDAQQLSRFCVTFIIGWKIWSDLTTIINMLEIDDILQRVAILFYLAILFGYTTNIAYGFEETYTSLISWYLAERLYEATYFVGLTFLLPTIRGTLVYNSTMIVLSAALWISSIHLDYPIRLATVWLAIVIDLFSHTWIVLFLRSSKRPGTRIARLAERYFAFYPAINIEHRSERNSAFVTLVFGYSVLTILYQSQASMGVNAFLGKGILGLVQSFTFNWIYFEIDQFNIHVHAIRRHWFSGLAWATLHLPFLMSFVLASATLSRLVLARDCSNTNIDDLGEAYQAHSQAELPLGLRWYYCCGIGIALICMAFISLCHTHKRVPHVRIKKRPRLFIRVCIGLIIICLPLAPSLTSLDLISITTALVVLVLVLDLVGNSCTGDGGIFGFFTGGFCQESKANCQYVANCHISKRKRRQLEKALRAGEEVTLEDVLTRQGSTGGDSEKGRRHALWSGHF